MTTSRPPRRRLGSTERRRLILEAATREFADLGYERASLRGIARRAGITTPVLYDHFDSKRALHVALLDHHVDGLLRHQGRKRDVEVGAALSLALFEDFFDWVRSNPYGWRMLFHDAPAERDVAAALRRARLRSTRQIASFVALAPDMQRTLGAGRVLIDEVVGQAIYGLLNGVAAWWWEHQDVPPRVLAQIAHDVVWHGLGAMTGLGSAREQ